VSEDLRATAAGQARPRPVEQVGQRIHVHPVHPDTQMQGRPMARADPPDGAPRSHRARGDLRVEYRAEGHQHSRGDPEADPSGPGHRTGEHDPPRRRCPHHLPHGRRDVDPPVPGPIRPGPRIEAADHRSGGRHPEARDRWRIGRRGRRHGTLGHRCRRGGRDEGGDGQQRGQDEPPPAASGPGRGFRIRRHRASSRAVEAPWRCLPAADTTRATPAARRAPPRMWTTTRAAAVARA
jgi:hypothetical protein